MEDEKNEVKEENKQEEKQDFSSVIKEAKELIDFQHKEIEDLKAEIASFKEDKKEEEKTLDFSNMLDDFKNDLKTMLQAYNRQNTDHEKEETTPTIDDVNFGFLNRRN